VIDIPRMFGVFEKGGAWAPITGDGMGEVAVDSSVALPAAAVDGIRSLVRERFADTMFFDETKRAMISVEQRTDVDSDTYTEAQTRFQDAAFDLYEFAAARLFVSASDGPNASQVALLGLGVGGTTLSATYDLAATGFTHFTVPPTWSHLEAMDFQGLLAGGGPGALALDDVGVGSGPVTGSVPEPAAIVLALTTALAVGAVLLRGRS